MTSRRMLLVVGLLFLAGCQADGPRVATDIADGVLPAIAQDRARIVILREYAEAPPLFSPYAILNEKTYFTIQQGGAYVLDIESKKLTNLRMGSKDSRTRTYGFFNFEAQPGEEYFFLVTHRIVDTLSPGVKVLSTILSGQPGDHASYEILRLDPAIGKEKMDSLKLAHYGLQQP